MAKQVCDCGIYDFPNRNNNTFFLFPRFNNKFASVNINPRTDTLLTAKKTNNDGSSMLNTNRSGPNPNCSTPYRVPYNHYRKTYTCKEDCLSNEKIIKDTPPTIDPLSDPTCYSISCRRKNYASRRLVNRFGTRNINTGLDYKHFLQLKGKLYIQNAFGLLPENKVPGKQNEFKIESVNGINETDLSMCKVSFINPTSITNNQYQITKMPTATRKFSNPKHGKNGSVTSRNRIQRLKYNATLAGQRRHKGYNNCVNGELCSLYESSGSNSKFFKDNDHYNCNGEWINLKPSRINGKKQTCPYEILPESTTSSSTSSPIRSDTPTEDDYYEYEPEPTCFYCNDAPTHMIDNVDFHNHIQNSDHINSIESVHNQYVTLPTNIEAHNLSDDTIRVTKTSYINYDSLSEDQKNNIQKLHENHILSYVRRGKEIKDLYIEQIDHSHDEGSYILTTDITNLNLTEAPPSPPLHMLNYLDFNAHIENQDHINSIESIHNQLTRQKNYYICTKCDRQNSTYNKNVLHRL